MLRATPTDATQYNQGKENGRYVIDAITAHKHSSIVW
jgi:hypothetical protein